MHTMIIGIPGGTGSGKTTLTDHLAAHFGPAISVVHHDNYYKRQDVPFEVRCQQNYDHPDAFDTCTPMPTTTAPMKRCSSGPPR